MPSGLNPINFVGYSWDYCCFLMIRDSFNLFCITRIWIASESLRRWSPFSCRCRREFGSAPAACPWRPCSSQMSAVGLFAFSWICLFLSCNPGVDFCALKYQCLCFGCGCCRSRRSCQVPQSPSRRSAAAAPSFTASSSCYTLASFTHSSLSSVLPWMRPGASWACPFYGIKMIIQFIISINIFVNNHHNQSILRMIATY